MYKRQEDGSIHASNPGRIKMATKILVDNRYGLMDDLNFASHTTTGGMTTADGNRLMSTGDFLKDNGITSQKGRDDLLNTSTAPMTATVISKSTRIKADRVRIYLDYYYSLLERCISIDNTEHRHEGVEGVYNPLQVMRNRKLRKKYRGGAPVREVSISKAPVIAIIDFSKKYEGKNKEAYVKKRMPWFVDINEKYNDLMWRTSHWDELVDPEGNLWFGDKDNRRHHHHHHQNRLHAKPKLHPHKNKDHLEVTDHKNGGITAQHLEVSNASSSSRSSSNEELNRKSTEKSRTPSPLPTDSPISSPSQNDSPKGMPTNSTVEGRKMCIRDRNIQRP